jgi:hypothetical protein
MAGRIIDTAILIKHFRLLQPYSENTPSHAEVHANDLIRMLGTNLTVTPVEIEVLAGVRDRHELELTEAYLKPFHMVDKRKIIPEDREEARRLAKHIPRLKQPRISRRQREKKQMKWKEISSRDLGDCLILAIARRLNLELLTEDKGLRTQEGRTRRRT